MLDLRAPELPENTLVCFKPLRVWRLVPAATGNGHPRSPGL